MQTISKNLFSRLIDKIAKAVHLDAKKTIAWYSYVLLVIPIAFWLLVELRALASNQSWQAMLKQPTIAIGIIITITDFMIGYYLAIRKQELLKSYESYHFFMVWQAVSHILVGNLVGFVLAIIGIHESKSLPAGRRDGSVSLISVVSGLLLIICFSFIILVNLKG
ncbi:putative membrane protein [Lactobacillus colini]|uniref:Membrane protein n=1 Tax=Lactobacillus colini TaxID=1819254 RepID=A0ABS4MDW2_9LACO|nr:hypothetical protein [Lactobacillus colini]MBP2057879.1 putative membrane protein [Lactobacillus colini]